MNKTIAIPGPTQEQRDKIAYIDSLGLTAESFTLSNGECIISITDDYDYEISTDEFEVGDSVQEILQRADMFSCCGDILDKDYMMCPTCKEHC
jgi:hypothetical protein